MNIFLSSLIDKKPSFLNKSCRTDDDCRISSIPDFNSAFCVNSLCIPLKGAGMPCYFPEECASYGFFGSIACSDQCQSGKIECRTKQIGKVKNTFCCKAIPSQGSCEIDRPGFLSGCKISQSCSITDGIAKCNNKPEKSWFIGTFLSISGNSMITLGINYQKRSYRQNYVNLGSNLFINTMLIGSLIYIAGKMISFASYAFANQSLLAGLSGTGLISNSIFAPLINEEIFTWKDFAAIFFVISGSSIIIANTSHNHVVYSLCELIQMYYTKETVLWIGFLLIMITVMFFFIKYVEINSDWNLMNDPFNNLLRSNSAYFTEDGFVCKYLMLFIYVFFSSFIAAFTTLSVKSLGEISNKIVIGETSLIYNKITLFFTVLLILCTFLQIYWLNRAFKHYDALIVVPIFHISWTLLSILTAGIYFQDFSHYSYYQFSNFIKGIVIIFCGSIFLGMRIVNKNEIKSRRIEIPEEEIRE
ncbi:magnesium transporter [Nucleospora cyclopteri]